MKWLIPAKTFLVGEYAAIAGLSSIVLTTTPAFELVSTEDNGVTGIHPQSPAGLWWQKKQCINKGFSWHDPYNGQGGLGASSAQFLACYLATCPTIPTLDDMLEAYYQCAWNGLGLKPSGYDVIAQSQQGCVAINKSRKLLQCFNWPFADLSFILVHTGVKLATHHHLQESTLPASINELSAIADDALSAFTAVDSQALVGSINHYHTKLSQLNLVADHSLDLINSLSVYPEVLAAKGCGAMGADIVLIICPRDKRESLINKLRAEQKQIVATEENLNQFKPIIEAY